MPSEILIKHGAAAVWASGTQIAIAGGGFAKTAGHDLDLSNLAAGAAHQGAKQDLALPVTAEFPARWMVSVAVVFIGGPSPANGETVDYYWASSKSSTAGLGNPGGTSGTDLTYIGHSIGGLSPSLLQLQYIGSLVATADLSTTIQYQDIGVLTTILQYGMPVVVNNTTGNLFSDSINMFVALTPLIDEAQ